MSDIILYIQEFFDINQTIGRGSYFFRIFNSITIIGFIGGIILSIFKIFFDIEKLFPFFIGIVLLIWIYLIICSSIKRARDIGSNGYIISGTIILTIITILLQAEERNYKILTILHLSTVIIIMFGLLIIQGLYLILFPGKY